MKKYLFRILLILTLCFTSLTSCKKDTASSNAFPFTEATWTSTLEDICSMETEEYEETVSVYGGYSYIFPKEYLGFEGSVQYMFDDKEQLVGIAWFYIGNQEELAEDIYESIYQEHKKLYGTEETLPENQMYHSAQWELEDRSIIMVSFSQNEEYAVQVSHISQDINKN